MDNILEEVMATSILPFLPA